MGSRLCRVAAWLLVSLNAAEPRALAVDVLDLEYGQKAGRRP